MRKAEDIFQDFLQKERINLPLWYGSAYLFGILYFFYSWGDINEKPNLYPVLAAIFCVSSLFLIKAIRSHFGRAFLLKIILAFLVGVIISEVRVSNITFHPIKNYIKNIEIEGEVAKIRPNTYGFQVTLDRVRAVDQEEATLETLQTLSTLPTLPTSIRVNLPSHSSAKLLNGDKIRVKCNLSPLPEQIVPGGYDFKKVAFFSGIGAICKALDDPEVVAFNTGHNSGILYHINYIRKRLYNGLIENLGFKNGNFAAGIFLGETGGIDQTTLNNMRLSGISHILCVSGLHLSLVASIFFLASRFILNLSDYTAHHLDVKKIAGCISILASFIYLVLTGMQIAATRAFIMVLCVMMSIILSKQPYPIRSLCFACALILTKNPEYVILPSFQLSFMAVLSLLSGFELYSRSRAYFPRGGGALGGVAVYFAANIYSSIIASLATAPIVMYHFYVYSNYSVIANLVAVPLVGFIIMPAGIMALIFSATGCEFIPLYLINKSIDIIKFVANWVVQLPYSVIYTGYVENFAIAAFVFGIFWLCFWKSRVRFAGLSGIAIFLMSLFLCQKPASLSNEKLGFVAKNTGQEVVIYARQISPFARNFVANWFGHKDARVVKVGRDGKYGYKGANRKYNSKDKRRW